MISKKQTFDQAYKDLDDANKNLELKYKAMEKAWHEYNQDGGNHE